MAKHTIAGRFARASAYRGRAVRTVGDKDLAYVFLCSGAPSERGRIWPMNQLHQANLGQGASNVRAEFREE